jgi:hypothetical protein
MYFVCGNSRRRIGKRNSRRGVDIGVLSEKREVWFRYRTEVDSLKNFIANHTPV